MEDMAYPDSAPQDPTDDAWMTSIRCIKSNGICLLVMIRSCVEFEASFGRRSPEWSRLARGSLIPSTWSDCVHWMARSPVVVSSAIDCSLGPVSCPLVKGSSVIAKMYSLGLTRLNGCPRWGMRWRARTTHKQAA